VSTYPLEYWQRAAATDPYPAVRTGWTAADFDMRQDDSLACRLDLRPDDAVLEYGCGPGYAARLVAPRVRRYVGLDYAAGMLTLARERCPAGEFVQGDGVSIPFPDGTFGAAFCELVFQHLTRPNTLAILAEIRRVLKPEGRALLQLPTRFYGDGVGFTVDELTALGWRAEADPDHPRHYIHCSCPTAR
jgi:SAM-dependent methyltransferase